MIPVHITETEWSRFWQHQLTPEEENQLLTHVCDCELCSNRMAEGIPDEQLLSAPSYLKEETLALCQMNIGSQSVTKPPIDAMPKHDIPVQGKKHSPKNIRLQLFTYSLKVGLAMAAALVLLLKVNLPDSSFHETDNAISLTAFLNSGTDFISNKLNEFSTNLIYKEDFYYEKQK